MTQSAMEAKTTNRVLSMCMKEGLIYITGPGLYAHTNYFMISEEKVKLIIQSVKRHLESKPEKAVVQLKSCIIDAKLDEFDYYDVRFVIRRYGYLEGIFFNGHSQSDVLCLSGVPERKRQSKFIYDWVMEKSDKQISLEDVMNRLKTSSKDNAMRVIKELLADNLIARKGDVYVPTVLRT